MGRLSLPQLLFSLTVVLVISVQDCLAFDEAREINDVRLFDETFIDINANEYRKSLELVWFDTLSGWRMGGGSTNANRLFINTHLKINHQLSDAFYFGFELEQDDFYAEKPLQPFLLFADIYPFYTTNIGFSFIGTASVDKKESDLGFALTFGRQPKNYLRVSWLSTDYFYNEKNDIDNAFYAETGETIMLRSSYSLNNHWDIHLDWKRHTPSDFVFDDQVSRFKSESYDYQLTIIYHIDQYLFVAINLLTLNDMRALSEPTIAESQDIDYRLLDVYWVTGVNRDYELTVGIRYDDFKEQFNDQLDQVNDYEFKFQTTQIYSAVYHDFTVHQAWDLGLYAGWSERNKLFTGAAIPDDLNEGIEAKLRTSWEYHSADKASRLLLSISFNLDDLIDDPSDGGGIYFQSQF